MSPDRTKSRKAKRDAAFNREPGPAAPASGRRPAFIPLRDRPLGHAAAIYYTATAWLKCSPTDAARLAATLSTRTMIVKIVTGHVAKTGEAKGEKADGLGLVYTAGDRRKGVNSLMNRANHILMTVPAMIDGASGDDQAWLELSMQGLRGLYFALRDFNSEGVDAAFDVLRELGWQAKVELFLKSQRYQRAKIELG